MTSYWLGKKRSKDTIRKIRLALKGRKLSDYHKEKIRRALIKNPPWKGKHFSKSHINHLKKSLKGRKSWNKGKPMSEKSKRRLSISLKRGYKNGRIAWAKNRKFSREHLINMSKCQQGNKSHHWKGGRRICKNGYVQVFYPGKRFKNKTIYEHRLVMEKHLGRKLDHSEVVHHINENRSDNRIENLMVFKNSSDHLDFHRNHSIT